MKKVIAALALFVSFGAHAGWAPLAAPTALTENFDSGLGAFSPINASTDPVGSGWFPGNPGVFPAQAGAPGSYAASNFLVTNSGSIAAWLISPELTFTGQTVSFFARTEDATLGFLDGLTLMVSTAGASMNLGDFVPLFSIGPGALADVWTQYSAVLGSLGSGRIAFLYGVADFDTANYVGVDTVSVTGGGTQVPEPASLALLGLGLGLIGLARRRHRGRAR